MMGRVSSVILMSDNQILTHTRGFGAVREVWPVQWNRWFDRMSLNALKVVQTVMKEVIRGPIGTMPYGQTHGGTRG